MLLFSMESFFCHHLSFFPKGVDMHSRHWSLLHLVFLAAFLFAPCCPGTPPARAAVAPLQIQGQDFIDPDGHRVRFWGVNLVAFYPTHAAAEKFAANLASRGINLVRWHHMNRASLDWNWQSEIPALLDYDSGTSRTPNSAAWDRFDYLNAELARHGIYIMLATHWTRDYLPADVSIMHTTTEDDNQWSAAMQDLVKLDNNDWGAAFDLKKLLPVIDERAARLEEEFLSRLELRARKLIALADNLEKTTDKMDVTGYRPFREEVDNFKALSLVIKERMNKLESHPKKEELEGQFHKLQVLMLRLVIKTSLKFFFVMSAKENLPLGAREMFQSELRTLYEAERMISDPRYISQLDESARDDLETAKSILEEIIEKAPALLNFGAQKKKRRR